MSARGDERSLVNLQKALELKMGEFAIGQGVSRFEDPRLIQGGGRYVDDIKLDRKSVV